MRWCTAGLLWCVAYFCSLWMVTTSCSALSSPSVHAGDSRLVQATATPLLDVLVLGDVQSEKAHSFVGAASIAGVAKRGTLPLQYPTDLTFRHIAADAHHTVNQTFSGSQATMLNVTLKVDPQQPTYLTLKLYGSDEQPGAMFLYWRPPSLPGDEREMVGQASVSYPGCVYIGAGLLQLGWYYPLPSQGYNGYAQIDLSNAVGRPFPRQFYFVTTRLPAYMTAGQQAVNLLIGGWGEVNGYFYPNLGPLDHDLKPVYRVYTHLDPYFVQMPSPLSPHEAGDPRHFDDHTLSTPSTRPPPLPRWSAQTSVTPEQIHGNLSAIRADLDATVRAMLGTGTNGQQVFGAEWNATLDVYHPGVPGATPAVIYGAIGVPFDDVSANNSREQWLQRAQWDSTNPNNVPMTFIGLLGSVWNTAWSAYYQDMELVERIVAGVDFFMHQQGSNGGMLATDPTLPWCGAPNRTDRCGSALDGVGPYSLGSAVLAVLPELERLGLLDRMVDYDLDAKLIPRREGWWRMFNTSIVGTLKPTQRGGCPSQDLLQVEGIVLANIAATHLLHSPPPLSDEELHLLLNQSLGFANEARFPENGPFFTEQGMGMECFGTLGGGGLDINYGSLAISLLLNLVLALPDTPANGYIRQRLVDYFRVFARYINLAYSELDVDVPVGGIANPVLLTAPFTIGTRGDFQPDRAIPSDLQSAVLFLAAQLGVPEAVRVIELQMLLNTWPSAAFGRDADSAFQFLATHPFLEWTCLQALNSSSPYFQHVPLPSELAVLAADNSSLPTPDNAWADTTGGAVQIKYRDELLYLNLNYRHQLLQVDYLVKLERKSSTLSQVALVAFEAQNGFFGVWTQTFGPYLIVLNRSPAHYNLHIHHASTHYRNAHVAGGTEYVDLRSGSTVYVDDAGHHSRIEVRAGDWLVLARREASLGKTSDVSQAQVNVDMS